MMEWQKQPPQQAEEPISGGGGGGMFVKVMTDEQIEILRKQIAVYVTICEQLVELHKSLTSHNDLAGMRLGNLYCDPFMTSGPHKITGRQRWTPTPTQLQILERIFDQGIGTPSKQKIKEITTELTQHGQISETNVYNWFQNRRARSKRKQVVPQANKVESEVEKEVESESPNEKKTSAEDLCFQNPQSSSAVHSVDPHHSRSEPMLPQEVSSKFGGSFGQMPFYGSVLSDPSNSTF